MIELARSCYGGPSTNRSTLPVLVITHQLLNDPAASPPDMWINIKEPLKPGSTSTEPRSSKELALGSKEGLNTNSNRCLGTSIAWPFQSTRKLDTCVLGSKESVPTAVTPSTRTFTCCVLRN